MMDYGQVFLLLLLLLLAVRWRGWERTTYTMASSMPVERVLSITHSPDRSWMVTLSGTSMAAIVVELLLFGLLMKLMFYLAYVEVLLQSKKLLLAQES
jgi:hypothetical protein